MVANLGDKIIVEDVEKYLSERKRVQWSQDFGVKKSVDFVFIPFYLANNRADTAYIAVEAAKLGEFQGLCSEVKEQSGAKPNWGSVGVTKYELTVTNQFKYGQNNEKTFRFLVFQNPSYKPFQHRFTEVAETTEAGTTLGNFARDHADLVAKVPYGAHVMDALKSVVGDDLHSF